MAQFFYQALDTSGREESGQIESESDVAALGLLASRGLSVFELGREASETGKPWYRRDIEVLPKRVRSRETAQIAALLATLFQAHLPVPDILSIAQKSTIRRDHARMFERAQIFVEEGHSLSEAFESTGWGFPPTFLALMRVGERANSLAEVLTDAAGYFAQQGKLAERTRGALIYPLILIFIGLALTAMVVFFLAPNLAPLFQAQGRELPDVLATVMTIRGFALANWQAIAFLSFVAVPAALLGAFSNTSRRLLRALARKLPVAGRMLGEIETGQIARGISLLVKSGVGLTQALTEMSEVFAVTPYAKPLGEAAASIQAGGRASAILGTGGVFPALFVEMFAAGEVTNRVAELMGSAAAALETSGREKAERLAQLVTPAMTLIVGICVGLLVYSIMGAILEINEFAF